MGFPLSVSAGASPPDPAFQPVSSWGRLSNALHRVHPLRDRACLDLEASDGIASLPFGNGRSYGDACLNPGGRLWTLRGLDRFIDFDPATGEIECEAGVLLDELMKVTLPQGWFLPVTPGTRFATLGGAIANDVHGKNHHRAGTLGEHVRSLLLARSDGSRIECSPTRNRDWLTATIGGLGLTGVIVSARLRLMRVPGVWMRTQGLPFGTLDEFFRLSRESERDWEYGVSWVDCLHGRDLDVRGIFFRGNHVPHEADAPPTRMRAVPLTPPVSLVNGVSLRAFNAAYFVAHRRRTEPRVQHLLSFFYPLDGLHDWNRIYGPRGFFQYQCVVPRADERAATAALLNAIRGSGQGSFLAVLKTFGDRAPAGLLSFPMAGTTLALDFPNLGERTERLFERLDAIVGEAGGRLYAAKDARAGRALFRQGYPRLDEFAAYRDPRISSALSRRLLGS